MLRSLENTCSSFLAKFLDGNAGERLIIGLLSFSRANLQLVPYLTSFDGNSDLDSKEWIGILISSSFSISIPLTATFSKANFPSGSRESEIVVAGLREQNQTVIVC